MTRRVLLRLAGNIWLANSWKQQLEITDEAIEGEIIEGLRRTKMTLPFDRIAQVNLHRGVLSATLEVINRGGAANLVVKGLKKGEAERAKALIEQQMRATATTQPVGTQPVSLADELQKLAAMRDRGILTAEEFDQQKRKLLVR